MSAHIPELVDTPSNHLWTDALHARALASQTSNKWNRDTYVRWTVTTAWTAFEIVCMDAVEVGRLGIRFKEKLDAAIKTMSRPKLNWESGIWQEVTKVYELRKEYVHAGVRNGHIFREAAEADWAIDTLREAIKTIYGHAGKSAPVWIDDNEDPGWDIEPRSMGHLTITHAGANIDESDTVKIIYVYNGKEYIAEVLPSGADTSSNVKNLISNIRVPISAVRVYKGIQLIEEQKLRMRGA